MKNLYSLKNLIILFCLINLNANAQERYVDEVFTDTEITVLSDVVYGINFSQYVPAAFGGPQVIPQFHDVYMPDTSIDAVTARPVVVLLHTGSFLPKGLASPLGERTDSVMVEIAMRFAKRGFVAIAASYRVGWLANSTNLDLRRGTNLAAVYGAIQDTKACVRSLRGRAFGNNEWRMDPNFISLLGSGSGGYVALAYSTLDNYAEVAGPTKFQYTAAGPGIYGGTVSAGDPYIDTAIVGDWNGIGGYATIIGSDSTTGLPIIDLTQPGRNIANAVGAPDNVNLTINLGGALADSAWTSAGDAPSISFHSRYDFYAPYYRGMVNVPIAGAFFPVVEVAGSHTAAKVANTLGNNTVLGSSMMMDPHSVLARSNSYNIGNEENIYTFNMVPPNPAMPFRVNSNPWDWWDANDPLSVNETNPNIKAQSMAYIDTIMAYTLPRVGKAMNAVGYSVGADELPDFNISVSPNPSTYSSLISSQGAMITSVSVYDVLGRPVYALENIQSSQTEIQTASWARGTYIVRIETDKGVKTSKLIRN
jgi:hypothetical protein